MPKTPLMRESTRPAPEKDLRGRPPVFYLPGLEIGKGLEVSVHPDQVRNYRGRLFAHAHHYGIAIKTQYEKEKQLFSVWRIEKKEKKNELSRCENL